MTEGWRQPVDHQAVRDAVLQWWAARHEPRGQYGPGACVAYAPLPDRAMSLREMAGLVGYVQRRSRYHADFWVLQFGGEEDGGPAITVEALPEEMIPL